MLLFIASKNIRNYYYKNIILPSSWTFLLIFVPCIILGLKRPILLHSYNSPLTFRNSPTVSSERCLFNETVPLPNAMAIQGGVFMPLPWKVINLTKACLILENFILEKKKSTGGIRNKIMSTYIRAQPRAASELCANTHFTTSQQQQMPFTRLSPATLNT